MNMMGILKSKKDTKLNTNFCPKYPKNKEEKETFKENLTNLLDTTATNTKIIIL